MGDTDSMASDTISNTTSIALSKKADRETVSDEEKTEKKKHKQGLLSKLKSFGKKKDTSKLSKVPEDGHLSPDAFMNESSALSRSASVSLPAHRHPHSPTTSRTTTTFPRVASASPTSSTTTSVRNLGVLSTDQTEPTFARASSAASSGSLEPTPVMSAGLPPSAPLTQTFLSTHSQGSSQSQSQLSSFVDEKNAVHGIRVLLKSGQNLLPCDSTGFSDPYCKFKIGKHAKYKSTIKRQTLKPNWSEEFFLPCPEDCNDPMVVDMYDWDGFSRDDYMGSCIVALSDINATPQEMTFALQNRFKKPMPADLGQVTFVVSRSVETSKKGTLLQRLLSGEMRNRLVAVDLIEAKGLPQLDGDASMDSYVKMKIGKLKHKSKVCERTSTPNWGQRFEFPVQDNSQVLSIQLCRAFVSVERDKLLANLEIELADLALDTAVDRWYPMTAHDAEHDIHIHLQVTVSDLFSDATGSAVTATPGKGILNIEVISARNLRAKESSRCDPFVVVELGNTRLRSITASKTVTPQWDRSFSMLVDDVFDNLQVTVHDEHHQNVIGRVLIPLQKISSTSEPQWFTLKDEHLFKRAAGEVQLRINLQYTLKTAAKQLISRRQQKYISNEDRLRFPLLKLHFTRVRNGALAIIGLGTTIDGLFAWRYGPLPSAAAMLFWAWFIIFFDWYLVPLLLLAAFMYVLMISPYLRVKLNFDERQYSMFSDSHVDTDDDDDDESAVEESSKKGLMEMWGEFQRVATIVQTRLDQMASFYERVKNLLLWTTPLITGLVCGALMLAALALYVIPLHWLLFLWGMKKFTKKGLQKYGVLPSKGPSLNEAMELIGRVPSDLDLVRCRALHQSAAHRVSSKSY